MNGVSVLMGRTATMNGKAALQEAAQQCAQNLPATTLYSFEPGWEACRVHEKWFMLMTEVPRHSRVRDAKVVAGQPVVIVKADPSDVCRGLAAPFPRPVESLTAVAEFQRDLIVANTHEDLAAACARGRHGGKRPKRTAQQANLAQQFYDAREKTVQQIADLLRMAVVTPPWTMIRNHREQVDVVLAHRCGTVRRWLPRRVFPSGHVDIVVTVPPNEVGIRSPSPRRERA